jgi:chemosensory pili system protein ChpC
MSSQLLSGIAVNDNELATLLLPVFGKQLVLPNVTVAEIIPYVEAQAEADVPGWYLGRFSWRNISVPLVSFEAINAEAFTSQGKTRRIAVLNGIVDGEKLPFCGIVTQGSPRLMRVMPDEVANDESGHTGPAELATVLISGEPAVIPDIDFIQQQLLALL